MTRHTRPPAMQEAENSRSEGSGGARRSKYGNQATYVDGRRFSSKREAARYQTLRLLELAGEIRALECQPRYPLVVAGVKVGTYVADFVYATAEGALVVEDAKGVRTPVYRLKAKLLRALYGHEVREV